MARSRLTQVFFVLLLAVGAFNAGLAAATALSTGVGWDSGIDTIAAQQVSDLPPGIGLRDAYDEVFLTSEFYGVFIQATGAGVELLLSEGQGSTTGSLSTYRVQALLSVLLLTVGVGLMALAVGKALGSRLAGAFAWASGLSIPLVSGLSAVDFKDTPVAAGLLIISSGLTIGALNHSARVVVVLLAAAVGFGGFVALSVRIGSWPLLLIVVSFTLFVFIALSVRQSERARVAALVVGTGIGTALALIGVYLLNPFARIDFPRWVFDAYLTSRAYPWEGSIRMAGTDVASTDLPWWYVPMWLVAQIPIPIQLLIIAGLASWIFLLGASRASQFPGRPVALTPFAVQAFLLPVAVVVAGAILYDGIRHLMFAVAAFPAFMACVIALLEFRVTTSTQSQWVRAGMHIGVALAVGALLFGTASIIAWFPYQYAYINEVATRFEGERPWELDFWGVTALEGTRKLQAMGASEVVILPQMAYPGTPEIVGALSVDQARELGDESVGVYTFLRYDTSLPQGCTTEFTIDRANRLLGIGGLCPASVFNPTED